MRTEGLMAKDKTPRKVAKKGQPGGRQEAGRGEGGFPVMPLWRCLLDLAAKRLLVMRQGDCPEVSLRDGGSRGLRRMR